MQSDTLLVREAVESDLDAVLSLYTHLHDADEKAGFVRGVKEGLVAYPPE